MAGSGQTLDIGMLDEDIEDVDGVDDEGHEAWGRLFPLGKGLKGLDLFRDEYSFGRADECDYCFERNGGRDNAHFRTFSNTHFRIYKEMDKNGSDNYVVFLQDKSTNGTFVNGERIGKNKKQVLNNDDEIGLSFKKNKVFVFNDKSESDKNGKLPKEFKETYTMSKLLGRGACGEVRLAFDRESSKRFAVKIISKKTFSVGPHLGRAAMEEVRIIKSMQHACIIRVEDLFETSDALYIILELVEGGELFDRVVSVGKFSERIAKLLFYQMLVAVKYLHDRGITHRDLKMTSLSYNILLEADDVIPVHVQPENILLASDEEETLIKVTDFGLSKFVGEQSLMKTLCGTPSYLAPEVIKSAGLGGYNNAVDCWSLGVILFIMLGGYPPFSDEIKEYSLHDQICNARYSFPTEYWKDVSSEATDLISKLLTVDSQERISTSDALLHPWMKDPEVIETATRLISSVIIQSNEAEETTSPTTRKRPLDASDDESKCKKPNTDNSEIIKEQNNNQKSEKTSESEGQQHDIVLSYSITSTITNKSSHSGDSS